MAHRYFVETPITGSEATLVGQEAHHLLHVMRAKPGDQVTLFDGGGAEFPARVESLTRQQVRLTILDRVERDRELAAPITLGVSLPKGDRQKWLVEKATELGVARLVPLETTRGVAQPVAGALDRLRRAVIEASKQCGRNRLLEIAEPEGWSQFVKGPPTGALKLAAHPGGARAGSMLGAERTGNPVWLAVGPEGGFTDDEIALACSAGWQALDLGGRILRVETAAIWLSALVTVATQREEEETTKGANDTKGSAREIR
jgi:16S rRNA (uracil1498-N3)-methyltransferase